MCAPNLICRTGGGELFRGELTDRLQHRIAGPPGRPIGDQQRLAHQGVKQIEDGVVVIGTCDGASALEVESTGEHRTPIQQRLFCAVEHVIGPTHRLAQRVMAFLASLGPDQQPEPVIEAIPHFAWGHRHHPGGGQFDGQGNPVEALTNLSNCGGFITADYREARCNALSALDEKARRRRVDSCAHVQRGHQPQLLVGDPQSFAAGGQDPHRRRMREYGFDLVGGSGEHVLAVVDHQQSDPALQRSGHRLADGLAGLLGDAPHRGHRVGHRRQIGDRSQFEKPDTV